MRHTLKPTKADDILIARFSIEETKANLPAFQKQHHQLTSLVFSRCGSLITCSTIKGLIISFDVQKVHILYHCSQTNILEKS